MGISRNMKFLILNDQEIKRAQSERVDQEFTDLLQTHAGFTPLYIYENYDFSSYEKELGTDGDEHLTDRYLRNVLKPIYTKYKESIDHVILQVHQDNWHLTGIWGTNYSNVYHGYQVHVCRFDTGNVANSLGTRYHEFMHSPDAIIKTYLGIDIAKLIGVPSWDKFCVHGGRPDMVGKYPYQYIRYKENTDALAFSAVYLRQAYKKRHDLYDIQRITMQTKLIGILQELVILYRQLIYKKSTINK